LKDNKCSSNKKNKRKLQNKGIDKIGEGKNEQKFQMESSTYKEKVNNLSKEIFPKIFPSLPHSLPYSFDKVSNGQCSSLIDKHSSIKIEKKEEPHV